MKRWMLSVLIYGVTAIATANWLDYVLVPAAPVGHLGIVYLAVAGSLFFAGSCILAPFFNRVSYIGGILALCASWPYFGLLSTAISWRDLRWVLEYHYRGRDEIAAIFLLIVATAYSGLTLFLKRNKLLAV